MSKTAVKKLHWRSKVQDSFVPLLGSSGDLGIAIGGGADYGEFPFVTSAPGGGLTVGDIILEIGGTPVLGMTLGDVRGVLNSCPHPIRIKTVSPGMTPHTTSPLYKLVMKMCEHSHAFPSANTIYVIHLTHNDALNLKSLPYTADSLTCCLCCTPLHLLHLHPNNLLHCTTHPSCHP